jgi:hypothetical protein
VGSHGRMLQLCPQQSSRRGRASAARHRQALGWIPCRGTCRSFTRPPTRPSG